MTLPRTPVTLTVNGAAIERTVDSRTLLVQFLRQDLGLTGTHVGCDTGHCGACVVLMDGRSVKSCTVLAAQADGRAITTIEGVAEGKRLHPVQQAFKHHHGLQCGFCTPGMVLTAIDMINRIPDLTEAVIRRELEGNLCRCTGYQNIVAAILAAAQTMTPTSHE